MKNLSYNISEKEQRIAKHNDWLKIGIFGAIILMIGVPVLLCFIVDPETKIKYGEICAFDMEHDSYKEESFYYITLNDSKVYQISKSNYDRAELGDLVRLESDRWSDSYWSLEKIQLKTGHVDNHHVDEDENRKTLYGISLIGNETIYYVSQEDFDSVLYNTQITLILRENAKLWEICKFD